MTYRDFDYIYKVILIGDSGVGKTNMTTRFVDDKFIDQTRTTIGVDFKTKNFIIGIDKIKVQIWDTGGQERYRCITRSFYKDTSGVIIVFDLTRLETFNNVKNWMKDIERNIDDVSNVELLIVGNKADLVDKRQVSDQDINELRRTHTFRYIETSAKDDLNIDAAFEDLVSRAHERGLYVYSSKDDETADIIILRDDGVADKKKICDCVIL